MKNLIINTLGILTVFTLLAIAGCEKEDDTSISYPTDGFYGTNLLALPDSTVLGAADYSFKAELGEQADLKIVITNFSISNKSVWFYTNANGWLISSYSGSQQQFQSNTGGSLDLEMYFAYGPGTCQVDYYENGSTITRSKYFTW